MRKLKRNRVRAPRRSTEGEKNLHREMAYLDENPAPENRNFWQPTYYNFDYIANRIARGIICNPHKIKAPQVGLEPTTLRLTAGSDNYCGILSDFASSCFLVLSHRK